MAFEIRTRSSLSWQKGGSAGYLDSGELTFSMTGTKGIRHRQTIGTSEEAIVLGEVPAASARFLIRNLDSTNKVTLRPASGGTASIDIGPGECACGKFASTVSAPYLIATTASVDVEVILIQA